MLKPKIEKVEQKRWTVSQSVSAILEAYKKDKRDELIQEGVTDDGDLIKKLVFIGLKDWLSAHPEVRDRYLLK